MKFKVLVVVMVLILIASGSLLALNYKHRLKTVAAQNTTSAVQQANSTKIVFAQTSYAPYSYQIFPGPLSQQAQAALDGFSMSIAQLQNGSTAVTLGVNGTNESQSVVLRPGYKLYIIETSLSDDGFRFDSSLTDDGFVVVTTDGYVGN